MKALLAGVVVSLALAAPAFAALKAGAVAPDFTTKAALGGQEMTFSLKDALKKGPVVLYFFPAAFTPGCTAEAHAFAEATDDFKKQGATLIGVTAGNIDRVAEFSKVECRDKFAVAADPGRKISDLYDSKLAPKPEWSDRTSYVIGKDGKIAYAYTDQNPADHVKNTMAAVMALKGAKG
ncbi:MAG TPA: peroxiredoxin [Caulobacteraceae bacterium]|jgi:peroxiredoxin|nr:peroxiredoxin [Caulobacteraceae bacterium]